MRAVRFRLTPELLIQALRLPEGTIPVRLYESEKYLAAPTYTMIVAGDGFDEVPESAEVPLVVPQITTITNGQGDEIGQVWDWGIDAGD